MSMHPKCNRIDCFANKCGARCDILAEQYDTDNCKFFKTDVEVEDGRTNAHKRLKEMGREDLIRKYEYNPQRKW